DWVETHRENRPDFQLAGLSRFHQRENRPAGPCCTNLCRIRSPTSPGAIGTRSRRAVSVFFWKAALPEVEGLTSNWPPLQGPTNEKRKPVKKSAAPRKKRPAAGCRFGPRTGWRCRFPSPDPRGGPRDTACNASGIQDAIPAARGRAPRRFFLFS